jgi:hypothetical protein
MFERSLADRGYAFVEGAPMRDALAAAGSLADSTAFASSWNDLALDRYLAEAGRCRRRRFAVYELGADGHVARQPHQPHFQHVEYNTLFGGVERWFEPITPDVGAALTMHTILRFCGRVFGALAPDVASWHVETHQFRIEARTDMTGQPTPEGKHRDGVDFVLVLLINRENIVSGETTVYDLAGAPLGSFTLTHPFDAALVDDNRVAHGVTPITPLDPARPGSRDVLVVTLRARDRSHR